MKKVIVASTNPVKVNAVLDGFIRMFPDGRFDAEGVAVDSKVGRQPMTEEETFRGAMNRVEAVMAARPEADFWVGLEGGVEDIEGEMHLFAWATVRSREGRWGKGSSGIMILPPEIRARILAGQELGEADDELFGRVNSKQANGTAGLLTGDAITRADQMAVAVVFALIPFKNPDLYPLATSHW